MLSHYFRFILLTAVVGAGCMPVNAAESPSRPVAIAIHGGAGTILREELTPAKEAAYHAALETALQAGHSVLQRGGTSLDAVVAAVKVLEDAPLFNAGKGAVFTSDGRNELDAAIMDGATRNAGAVSGITRIRNPVELARLVMERSPHILLVGAGAEAFAREQGMTFVDPEYFRTEERWQQLQRVKAAQADNQAARAEWEIRRLLLGTVGAVALDRHGNLAVATSTGGLTNKHFGRVGDTPIIGAGTYADNATCAVSGTGHGESFMRGMVAHDIAALMEYRGMTVNAAAEQVVMEKLVKINGTGGVIALDGNGNIAMPFNTPGMYRGYINTKGEVYTAIFAD